MLLNVSIFVHDSEEWPDADNMTAGGTRDEVQAALHGWGPHVGDLVEATPRTH